MSDRNRDRLTAPCTCAHCEDLIMPDGIAKLIEDHETASMQMAWSMRELPLPRLQFYRDRLSAAHRELWHAVVAFGRGS